MMILLRVWLILSWSAATPLNVDNDDIPSIDTVNGDGVDSDGLHNHALENTNRDAKHVFHGGDINFSGTIDSSGNHAGINIGSISSNAASQESQPELQVCPADVAVTKDCMCAGISCATGSICVGGSCTAVCPADVAVTKDCMCAGISCATGSTCVGGSTCSPVCPADVAVTNDCMCAGISCATGSTCVGGSTCTPVCPADVAVTKDCMCAGKSCATGSTCVGGSTCTPDRLLKGQKLLGEEFLRSQNGEYDLVMQSDGNLVIYEINGRTATYSTATFSGAGSYLVLQADGNLVIHKEDGMVLWATNTQSADSLVMQNDGNLVLYAADNALWSSNDGSLDIRSPCKFNDDLIQPPFSECSGSCSPRDTGAVFRWKNNIIPYYYSDQNTKVADKALIRNVMNTIEKKTCFMFRETNKDDYKYKHSLEIVIQPEPCSNTVTGSVDKAKDFPDRLLMELTAQVTKENGKTCGYRGVILHELMHVLGVQHTQRRRDRDEKITVKMHNLPSDKENIKNQYRKCESCELFKNIPYDCDSIMHYGTHFNQKEVIEPKDTSTCKLQTQSKLYDDAFADGSYTDWKLLNLIGSCIVCNTDTFKCASGQCINPKWKCDGIEDCEDKSDEKDCKTVCVESDDLFKCSSGDECIYSKMRCDGVPDCDDHSDEDEDECQELACEDKQFFCGGKCIPLKRKCDGYKDCVNGEDEINCPVCPDDVAVPLNCMCAGKSCAKGSTCVGGSTCTPGKVWRDDGRCGTDSGTGIEYLLPNGKPARCNPTSNWPCCSKEGWCGNTAKHCQCVGCDSYKGILNEKAVTKYTESTQAMGDKLQKLRKESGDTISHEEVKLERKMVETRMYLKDKCESEKGACESEKIDRFTEESESIFQNIQKTGKVSSDFLGSFEKQKEKLDKAAEEVRNFIKAPKQLWRDDGKCGTNHKLDSGEPAQCDKTRVDGHCCSKEGWCRKEKEHCDCPECVNYAECTCSEYVDEKGFGKCQTGEKTLFEGSPYCYVNWPSSCKDLVQSKTNPKKWRSAEPCTDVSGGEDTGGCSFNDNTLAKRILPNGNLSPFDSTENYRWADRKSQIPYYFAEEHTSHADKEEVRKVMKTIMRKTCFEFREKTNKDTWKSKHSLEIIINSENDCSNPCTTGGSVDKRIETAKGLVLKFDKKLTNNNGACGCEGLILHELMHVLGVAHTQKRKDRDYTITVADLTHITKKNKKEQYDICEGCKLFKDIPYDCDSVMHYGGGEDLMVPKNDDNCTLFKSAKYTYTDFSGGSKTDWKLLNIIGNCVEDGNKWVRECFKQKTC